MVDHSISNAEPKSSYEKHGQCKYKSLNQTIDFYLIFSLIPVID